MTAEEHPDIVINGLCQGGLWRWGLPAARAGGVTATNLTVAANEESAEAILRIVDVLRTLDRPDMRDGYRIVETVADIEACHETGRTGVIIGFQNADPLGDHLHMLDLYHRVGLRILQLTYQRRNRLGDGCGESRGGGLSDFGLQVVERCNALGVLVDVSHVGHQSTMEAIEASRDPVAITHANVAKLNPIARNKTDEAILACAQRGGIMGITAISRLISPTGNERAATLDDFLDQVDYVAQLAGIDHVGLGLDIFEDLSEEEFQRRQEAFLGRFPELKAGGEVSREAYFVEGLSSAAQIGSVREGLAARGYAPDDVRKVMGGNFLRVFSDVWPKER